jgi:putative membrane protein
MPATESQSKNATSTETTAIGIEAIRSLFGGSLMGLANLVPGISGGTMLMAAGIYTKFIGSIAEITRLRFRLRSLVVLGCVLAAAALAILLGAGVLKDLVVNHRWVMYSLFIGLTLGGVPAVWRIARPANTGFVVSAVIAFSAMIVLAVLKANDVVGSGSSNFLMYFVAGLAGASAMVLPGISGGYILLLMGQYIPVLSAIDQFTIAIKSKDFTAAMEPAVAVLLPVGFGVVLGVVIVANLIQWLLQKHRQATLGFLLGLLLGSVVGLWPYQDPVEPKVGDMIKGQTVTVDNLSEIDSEDWRTKSYPPDLSQIGGGLVLVLIGFVTTMGLARIGGGDD